MNYDKLLTDEQKEKIAYMEAQHFVCKINTLRGTHETERLKSLVIGEKLQFIISQRENTKEEVEKYAKYYNEQGQDAADKAKKKLDELSDNYIEYTEEIFKLSPEIAKIVKKCKRYSKLIRDQEDDYEKSCSLIHDYELKKYQREVNGQ